MKPFIILALLYFTVGTAYTQVYSKLKKINFTAHSDYVKSEPLVMECVDFVLDGPPKENETDKEDASKFIIRWMEGTPDHTFTIASDFTDLTGGREDLSGLYFASLVKATIENKSKSLYLDEVNIKARDIYLDYCADPENKVRNTKAVKKLLKEREE